MPSNDFIVYQDIHRTAFEAQPQASLPQELGVFPDSLEITRRINNLKQQIQRLENLSPRPGDPAEEELKLCYKTEKGLHELLARAQKNHPDIDRLRLPAHLKSHDSMAHAAPYRASSQKTGRAPDFRGKPEDSLYGLLRITGTLENFLGIAPLGGASDAPAPCPRTEPVSCRELREAIGNILDACLHNSAMAQAGGWTRNITDYRVPNRILPEAANMSIPTAAAQREATFENPTATQSLQLATDTFAYRDPGHPDTPCEARYVIKAWLPQSAQDDVVIRLTEERYRGGALFGIPHLVSQSCLAFLPKTDFMAMLPQELREEMAQKAA